MWWEDAYAERELPFVFGNYWFYTILEDEQYSLKIEANISEVHKIDSKYIDTTKIEMKLKELNNDVSISISDIWDYINTSLPQYVDASSFSHKLKPMKQTELQVGEEADINGYDDYLKGYVDNLPFGSKLRVSYSYVDTNNVSHTSNII